MAERLYAKIHLRTDGGRYAVARDVGYVLGGDVAGRSVRTARLHIEAFDNRPSRLDAPVADFVDWPVYLEIEAHGAPDAAAFAADLRGLMGHWRRTGVDAVLSGAFEDAVADLSAWPPISS